MHSTATLEVSVRNSKAWEMAYQTWTPEEKPSAIVLIAHGLAEHGGRYTHVANFLNSKGYVVYAMDHIGHGNSEGERGHLNRFSQFLDGVAALRNAIQKDHPELPVFLLGHSMGGLIAANYLIKNQAQFSGCILSGPAIITTDEPPKLLLLINSILAKIMPNFGMLQLDEKGVSRDPEVVQKYLDDPLVFNGKISARFIDEMFASMAHVRANAEVITLPLLIMHGGSDLLTSTEGSKLLHECVASEDKTLRIYPELYHEIFNEPEKETIMAELGDWISTH